MWVNSGSAHFFFFWWLGIFRILFLFFNDICFFLQFLDELNYFKENRIKGHPGKRLSFRLEMSDGSTVSGLDQVLNMHRGPTKVEHPSPSEFITYEELRHAIVSKRTRGRPKGESPKPKPPSEPKANGDKIGKRRGRPSKSKSFTGRPLNCGLCDFKADDLYDLEGHLKMHSNQNVYECPYCNSTFSQKGNLITHIRTHTKEKPFKCVFCDFAASQKVNLQVHIRTHTKEKPFKCSLCDFSTAQKCNLVAHVTRRHSNVEVVKALETYENQWGNTDTQLKYYRCGMCMFSCRLKREMVDHVKIQHPFSSGEYQTIDVLK